MLSISVSANRNKNTFVKLKNFDFTSHMFTFCVSTLINKNKSVKLGKCSFCTPNVFNMCVYANKQKTHIHVLLKNVRFSSKKCLLHACVYANKQK